MGLADVKREGGACAPGGEEKKTVKVVGDGGCTSVFKYDIFLL